MTIIQYFILAIIRNNGDTVTVMSFGSQVDL